MANQTLLKNNVVNQIAFVVRDIEAASEAFAALLGIPKPKWFLTGGPEISQIVFRGQPTASQCKLVFIDTPAVQIELIEPNREPGTMREFLDTVGEGIHHIAFDADHLKDQLHVLSEAGYPVLQTGEFTSSNGRYAYVDTLAECKTLIELLERDEPQPKAAQEPIAESLQPLLGTTKVEQLAFVVKDIEAAADAYCTLLGVEKPLLLPSGPAEVTQIEYLGQPTEGKAKMMFIKTPLIEIELIEPAADSPSTWNQHLEEHGEGIHHISFVVQNMEEKIRLLEEMGYPVIQKGNFWNGKGKYAYMDTTSDYKVIIELLEKFN